jgi:O-Antigen ligase
MPVGFEVFTRETPMLKKFLSFDNWTKLVVFYLWCSQFLGKASVYVGLALGGLLIFSTRVLWDRWYLALTRGSDPLNRVAWAILVSLLYGIAEVIYGVSFLGYPLFTALQILVFNICPVYLFLGIWVGKRHPGAVRKYIRFLAWLTVIYAPLYFLFFQHLNLTLTGILPGTGLDILSGPGSGTVPLLGLLSLESSLAQFWLPIVVLVLMTIAYQERSDWLGLGLCLLVWGKISGKLGRIFGILGCIFAVLLIAALMDVKLPPVPGRANELSARGTIARMAGSISPEMASEFGVDAATARQSYGTVYWRKRWWAAIRSEVSKEYKTMIFGLGYGYPLGRLNSIGVEKEGVRSPHNIFYFTLSYSGLVGFAIFAWLAVSVLLLLRRVHTITGDTFGLLYFLYSLIGAFFGNLIETPQAAIPLYLVIGMVTGPIFLQIDRVSHDEEPVHADVAEMV